MSHHQASITLCCSPLRIETTTLGASTHQQSLPRSSPFQQLHHQSPFLMRLSQMMVMVLFMIVICVSLCCCAANSEQAPTAISNNNNNNNNNNNIKHNNNNKNNNKNDNNNHEHHKSFHQYSNHDKTDHQDEQIFSLNQYRMGLQLQQQVHQLAYDSISSPTLKWIPLNVHFTDESQLKDATAGSKTATTTTTVAHEKSEKSDVEEDEHDDEWSDLNSMIDLDWDKKEFHFKEWEQHVEQNSERNEWNWTQLERMQVVATKIANNSDQESFKNKDANHVIYQCVDYYYGLVTFLNPTPNTLYLTEQITAKSGKNDQTESSLPSHSVLSRVSCEGYSDDVVIETWFTPRQWKLETDQKMQVEVSFRIIYISDKVLSQSRKLQCENKWFSFEFDLNRVSSNPMRQLRSHQKTQSLIIHPTMAKPLLSYPIENLEKRRNNLAVIYRQLLAVRNPTNATIYITKLWATQSEEEFDLSVRLLANKRDIVLPVVEKTLVGVWTLQPFEEKQIAMIQIRRRFDFQHNLEQSVKGKKKGDTDTLRNIGFVHVSTSSSDPLLNSLTVPIYLNITDAASVVVPPAVVTAHSRQYLDFGTFVYPSTYLTNPSMNDNTVLQRRSREIYLLIDSRTSLMENDISLGFEDNSADSLVSVNSMQVTVFNSQRREQLFNERCEPQIDSSIEYPSTKTKEDCLNSFPSAGIVAVATFTALNSFGDHPVLKNENGKDEVLINGKFRLYVKKNKASTEPSSAIEIFYKAKILFGGVGYPYEHNTYHLMSSGFMDSPTNTQHLKDVYITNQFRQPLQIHDVSVVIPPVPIGNMNSESTVLSALLRSVQVELLGFVPGLILRPEAKRSIGKINLRFIKDSSNIIQHDKVTKLMTTLTLYTNASRIILPVQIVAHPANQYNLSYAALDAVSNPSLYGTHISKRDVHFGAMKPGETKTQVLSLINEHKNFIIDIVDYQYSGEEHIDNVSISIFAVDQNGNSNEVPPEIKKEKLTLPVRLQAGERALVRIFIGANQEIHHAYNGSLLFSYNLMPTAEYLNHFGSTPDKEDLKALKFQQVLKVPLQYYVLDGTITFKSSEFYLGKTFRGSAGPLLKQSVVVAENTFNSNDSMCINITRASSTDSRFSVELNRGCIKSASSIGSLILDPRKRNMRDYSTIHYNEDPYDYMILSTTTTKSLAEVPSVSATMRTAKVSVARPSNYDDMMSIMDDDELVYMDEYPSHHSPEELDSLLSEDDENEDLILALFKRCKRSKKYTDLPTEQKKIESTITFETSVSRKFSIVARADLVLPNLQFFTKKPTKNQQGENSIRVSMTRLGSSREFYIHVRNPGSKPLRIWKILIGDHSLVDLLSIHEQNTSAPLDEVKIRDKWGELRQNTTVRGSKESMFKLRDFTLSKKRLGSGVVIPGEGDWMMGPFFYSPKYILRSDAVIYVMNNLTYCDWIFVSGVGAGGRLSFSAPNESANNTLTEKSSESDSSAQYLRVDSLRWIIPEDMLGRWEDGHFIPHLENQPFSFTTKFGVSNSGNLKVIIWDVGINGRGCEAYGLRIHNCKESLSKNVQSNTKIRSLHPGQRSVMKISFTPDFTSSEVNLTLRFTTQSIMNQNPGSKKAHDPIDYIDLPLSIAIPRKSLSFLYQYQRLSSKANPAQSEGQEVHISSLLSVIVSNAVWIMRCSITATVIIAAVYVINVTVREWSVIDFGNWKQVSQEESKGQQLSIVTKTNESNRNKNIAGSTDVTDTDSHTNELSIGEVTSSNDDNAKPQMQIIVIKEPEKLQPAPKESPKSPKSPAKAAPEIEVELPSPEPTITPTYEEPVSSSRVPTIQPNVEPVVEEPVQKDEPVAAPEPVSVPKVEPPKHSRSRSNSDGATYKPHGNKTKKTASNADTKQTKKHKNQQQHHATDTTASRSDQHLQTKPSTKATEKHSPQSQQQPVAVVTPAVQHQQPSLDTKRNTQPQVLSILKRKTFVKSNPSHPFSSSSGYQNPTYVKVNERTVLSRTSHEKDQQHQQQTTTVKPKPLKRGPKLSHSSEETLSKIDSLIGMNGHTVPPTARNTVENTHHHTGNVPHDAWTNGKHAPQQTASNNRHTEFGSQLNSRQFMKPYAELNDETFGIPTHDLPVTPVSSDVDDSWLSSVPRRTRSVSPTKSNSLDQTMAIQQPQNHHHHHLQQHHQQRHQEDRIFQRLTQAFQPSQQDSGYFSLFSGPEQNSFNGYNPMFGGNPAPLDHMFSGSGLNYGWNSFGSERSFVSANPTPHPAEEIRPPTGSSLFTGNSSSFFSSSPSRFSFIRVPRELDEELGHDFELERPSSSASNTSDSHESI